MKSQQCLRVRVVICHVAVMILRFYFSCYQRRKWVGPITRIEYVAAKKSFVTSFLQDIKIHANLHIV